MSQPDARKRVIAPREGFGGMHLRVLAHALMEAEVIDLVGAECHERTDERTG